MAEVKEHIVNLLTPLLEGTDIFLVDIKIKPTNNVKVFIDADKGLSIDKSAGINRKLYAQIEEAGLFPPGDFSLEVSSPGVDEPLKLWRQYRKNIGRTVAITLNETEQTLTGVLKDVTEDEITLEIKQKKSKNTETQVIPFTQIHKTIVQIVF
jgi:ribosome maturation factor RimP